MTSEPFGWHVVPDAWVMGSGSLQSGLEWSLKYLERQGIKIPNSGRHRSAVKILAKWNDAPGVLDLEATPPEDLQEIQMAHRTAWECLVITCAMFRHRRKRHHTPFARSKIEKIMRGGNFPALTKTEPWDIQFELFTAAMLVHGGLEVRSGEPDLRLRYGYETVGVAAKRLTSVKAGQLERQVDKAVTQIERTGLRGWIALNIDSRFGHIRLENEATSLLREFNAVFDSVTHGLRDHFQNRNVLGVMLYGYLSEWVRPAADGEKPQLSTSVPFRWHGWIDEAGEQLLYHDVSRGWRERVNRQLRTIADGSCE